MRHRWLSDYSESIIMPPFLMKCIFYDAINKAYSKSKERKVKRLLFFKSPNIADPSATFLLTQSSPTLFKYDINKWDSWTM